MKRISKSKMRCLQVALCFALGLSMLFGTSLAFSQPTNSASRHLHHQRQPQQQQNSVSSYNNLDDLISDIMMEADSRLKKSKGNTLRQVKQTLRFGRSDPWYPVNSQEQLSLTMDESDDDQSRLTAFNRRRRRR